jgi:uncharacterized membrane protein
VKRPRAIVVAAVLGALVVVAAIAVFVIAPWGDPNHQSAEHVVRNAGVPVGVTPGAPP